MLGSHRVVYSAGRPSVRVSESESATRPIRVGVRVRVRVRG